MFKGKTKLFDKIFFINRMNKMPSSIVGWDLPINAFLKSGNLIDLFVTDVVIIV